MRTFRFFTVMALMIILHLTTGMCQASFSLTGGLTHLKTAKIGEEYKGAIIIKNNGSKAIDVRIYQTDYLFFSDGRNIYGKPGEDKRSNAKWIDYNPGRLTIPASSSSEVSYVVKVPDDQSLTGVYWSMMMVEEVKEEQTPRQLKKNQIGIRQLFRYGVQMITCIGNTGKADLKSSNFALVKTGEGKRKLEFSLENTGEKLLTMSIWIEIYDREGKYMGKHDDVRVRLFPGTSVRRSVEMGDYPPGEYKAVIIMDTGKDQVFGASYNLILK